MLFFRYREYKTKIWGKHRLNIGIDGRSGMGVMCGFMRHIMLLLKGLTLTKTHHQFLLFSDGRMSCYSKIFPSVKIKMPRLGKIPADFIRRDQLSLPELLEKKKINLFHGAGFPIPCSRLDGCRFILTVHDVIPWLNIDVQDKFSRGSQEYMRKWLAISMRKADAIIAVSETTKRDLMKFFDLPARKLRVVYNYVDPYFRFVPDKRAIRRVLKEKMGIEGEFVLNVSNISPRKNIETLIRAHEQIRLRNKKCQLIIVGAFSRQKPFKKYPGVVFTGTIPDLLLLYLYNSASVMVYPSIYEGFGYPPLEAMACGTPVITAQCGALPEILGDAGCFFANKDVSGLARKIVEVIENTALRYEMIQKGFSRVQLFSQRSYVAQIMRLYQDINSEI